MICHACGREVRLLGRVGRLDRCNECGADLHCCRNCRFFDAGARFECREPIAEPVRDKAAANHCEHFAPNTKMGLTGASKSRTAADDARKAFDQLFRKKS